MMEFIITLPLHLLALLGTVYLGTLATDRTAVVGMDHFSAFISRTALSSDSAVVNALKDFYFPEDSYITLKQEHKPVPPPGSDYLYLSQSRLAATRSLPVWLEGIRTVSRLILHLEDESNALLQKNRFTAFNEKEVVSAALLKNPRYTVDRSTTADWAGVANERFIAGNAPAGAGAIPLSEYTRNPDCEIWSIENL